MLYLPRKEGGTSLIGIEECIKKERKSLFGNLRESTSGAEGEGVC